MGLSYSTDKTDETGKELLTYLSRIASLMVHNIGTEAEHPFTSKTQRDELRTEPDSSIAEIAYSCGFNDISYFNRCFLKAYKTTPSAYKKNQQIYCNLFNEVL